MFRLLFVPQAYGYGSSRVNVHQPNVKPEIPLARANDDRGMTHPRRTQQRLLYLTGEGELHVEPSVLHGIAM